MVSKDSGARINNSMDNATEPFPGQKVVGNRAKAETKKTNTNTNTNAKTKKRNTCTNTNAKTNINTITLPFPGQKVVERALSVVHGEEAQVRMVIMYPYTAETMDVLGNTGCFFTLGLPLKVQSTKKLI